MKTTGIIGFFLRGNDWVLKCKYVDIRKSPVMSVARHDTPFFKGETRRNTFSLSEKGSTESSTQSFTSDVSRGARVPPKL